MSNHNKICPNGCEFALRSTLLAYTAKEGEQYVDAEYHWRCKECGELVTPGSIIYKVGCATYNYVRSPEPCICTPEPAHEPEPAPEPTPSPEPIVTPQRIEPRFVPEQSTTTPAPEPVITAPLPKIRKPRSKPAATITVPVIPVISDTIPVVSVPTDIPKVSDE